MVGHVKCVSTPESPREEGVLQSVNLGGLGRCAVICPAQNSPDVFKFAGKGWKTPFRGKGAEDTSRLG